MLVRHGETEWSRNGQHTGRTDVPLAPVGAEQARLLGVRLLGRSFSLVVTSPLRRASDTCRLIGFGDNAVILDDLAEWDYGDYEGITTEEIHAARPSWNLWQDGVPGGESVSDVGTRAARVIDMFRDVAGDVLVVSHGHMLRVLAACWTGLRPADGARLGPPATASIGRLGVYQSTQVILSWSC